METIKITRRREMSKRRTWALVAVLILSLAISACGTQQPEVVGGFEIPAIEKGKFNVAFVLIGPHDDGGWSQSHYEGLEYVQNNVDNVHTAYIENVPEGADSEQVFRSLSRKGFNVIFGTSFGYMDPMETVAGEFPDITYIHISGYKSNSTNFGNLFGAVEDMKYLAGMLAGSRAKTDGNPKLGYMATFPIPEELRLGNAFALGMKKTCPECTMDVRWISTWHDPVAEKDAAASLIPQPWRMWPRRRASGALRTTGMVPARWITASQRPTGTGVPSMRRLSGASRLALTPPAGTTLTPIPAA
jgi:basic membrane protein A